MALYAVLGVGVGNVGRGQARRRPMDDWVLLLNARLAETQPRVEILRYFRHTGNFLAASPSDILEEVSDRFDGLLETEWVVRPLADVGSALSALSAASRPQVEAGIRWTAGLVLHGGAGVPTSAPASSERAVLWRISPAVVGAWKRDRENGNGGLNSRQRGGGWGAVAADVGRQLGGRWTARSKSTVQGLIDS